MASLDRLAKREGMVHPVPPDPLVRRVHREVMGRMGHQVLRALWAAMGHQVWTGGMDCLASQDVLASAAARVPTGILYL